MSNEIDKQAPSRKHEEPDAHLDRTGGDLELGAWYWVKDVLTRDDPDRDLKKGDDYEWFGCAIEIGTNYVEIESPWGGSCRIHLDDYWTSLRKEAAPEKVIQAEVDKHMAESQGLTNEMYALVARLGVSPRSMIAPQGRDTGGTALVAMSSQPNLSGYRNALIAAKETDLPALKKSLESAHRSLTYWLKASMLPLRARLISEREVIETIDDRLFSLTLYAGLAEHAVQCSDGEPAPYDEPLHVFQRRAYMDEECLLNYEAGGMTFKGIGAFDAWIARPENRDRILPFPRTLVAMRVRRIGQERDVVGGSLLDGFITMHEMFADKFTYLYLRNGDQVWRISCEIDFGEMIFPDTKIYRPDEEMMFYTFSGSVKKIVPKALYEQALAAYTERQRNYRKWDKANPGANSWMDNPFRFGSNEERIEGVSFDFSPRDWHPLNRSSVFYDEAMALIEAEVKQFNRVAVIIQGLFDRSEVLHPHPPVKTWLPDSFARSVKLVYDASYALHDGEKPDFEAYRDALNASLGVGSVVVGQEDFWLRREAEKENAIREKDWRSSSARYTRFRPYGDPGPGCIVAIKEWRTRAREATFSWTRDSRRIYGKVVSKFVTVAATELLNVSAYTPGDYKRFFTDPRTRAEYIKWAPYLLAAEDWHAGKDSPRWSA